MSGRLPIWEIPLSRNSRTQMTERHSDLTVTSLLTWNHIKTPTVWLLQARQLWPHSFIFSLCAHFLSPPLDFDFYSAVTTPHSRLPYVPVFAPIPNFADSLMYCHLSTHSCWWSSSLTPTILLHVCSSTFLDSSILGSIPWHAFLFWTLVWTFCLCLTEVWLIGLSRSSMISHGCFLVFKVHTGRLGGRD